MLADTCIWSAAFRRRRNNEQTLSEDVLLLKRPTQQRRAVIIGSILQEVLTCIKEIRQFDHLKEQLSAFKLLPLEPARYVQVLVLSRGCSPCWQVNFWRVAETLRDYALPLHIHPLQPHNESASLQLKPAEESGESIEKMPVHTAWNHHASALKMKLAASLGHLFLYHHC